MDENVRHAITLACYTLLQKNAADDQKSRACGISHKPKTKKEAIELLLKVAGEPAIALGNVTDALWIVY